MRAREREREKEGERDGEREREREREEAIPDCYPALCSWTGWGRRREAQKGRR